MEHKATVDLVRVLAQRCHQGAPETLAKTEINIGVGILMVSPRVERGISKLDRRAVVVKGSPMKKVAEVEDKVALAPFLL